MQVEGGLAEIPLPPPPKKKKSLWHCIECKKCMWGGSFEALGLEPISHWGNVSEAFYWDSI